MKISLKTRIMLAKCTIESRFNPEATLINAGAKNGRLASN